MSQCGSDLSLLLGAWCLVLYLDSLSRCNGNVSHIVSLCAPCQCWCLRGGPGVTRQPDKRGAAATSVGGTAASISLSWLFSCSRIAASTTCITRDTRTLAGQRRASRRLIHTMATYIGESTTLSCFPKHRELETKCANVPQRA
jgi:hypothetical protein